MIGQWAREPSSYSLLISVFIYFINSQQERIVDSRKIQEDCILIEEKQPQSSVQCHAIIHLLLQPLR
jgi:hypothetical protein